MKEMTTKEVADKFYKLSQQGNWQAIQEELFSNDAVSIEPEGSPGLKRAVGMDAIRKKGENFQSNIEEVHGGWCKEPQVAGSYFVCTMGMDITMKGAGRTKMEEVALYEVKDGKIVSEQFFYDLG